MKMIGKIKVLFFINQFFKGGAESALLNLFNAIDSSQYDIDFLIYDQLIIDGVVSLIPRIPSWINVCNAAEGEKKNSLF